MNYLPYVWIAVMVIMAVAEGLTTQLVSVWFVVGALAAAIVSFFVPNLAIQLALFVGVSLFMLIITKPYVQKARQVAVVTQEINNTEGTGQVKVSGNTWTARTENNQIISEGTKVTVKEISGVKLIVTPVVSTEK